MERELVIIDLPPTIGAAVRPMNRNYVARFARVVDLSIETDEVELDAGGLEL